ncbi:MAG: trypsin-like peptidase domain-containing protein [Nitrososphaeria archaeon]|nr:trypsin-like peptidase domain-containing protein [Nitrososphaeria archaeon]
MRVVYVLMALSLSISILTCIGLVLVYQRVLDLTTRINQFEESTRQSLASLRVSVENRILDLNRRISEMNLTGVQAMIIKENLTAPEFVYEKVKDSVVLIKATVIVETFFGRTYSSSEGSGFVYDSLGHIVTNYHVIEGAVDVEIFFPDKSIYDAEVIGQDPYADLAVLKINPGNKTLRPLVFGNSSNLRVGQPVIAVGNPFGLAASLTTGVISQLNRVLTAPGGRLIPRVIQFDAAINPGSSGGPLLDYSGNVIGVTTAIASATGEFAGIGFAIPSSIAARVVRSLIEVGKYEHPWMGIAGVDVNMEIARLMNLPKAYGFLITDVTSGSPADKAGLRGGTRLATLSDGSRLKIGGDVILGVDGMEIFGLGDLLAYLEEYKRPGDEITLTIYREGGKMDVKLVLGAIS